MTEDITTQDGNELYSINYSFDLENAVILSLEVMNKNLGVSILDCSTGTLRILPRDYILNVKYDTKNSVYNGENNYGAEINLIIGQLLNDVTPTSCIVSSRLYECCFEYLSIKCKTINCKLELLSNQYFKKLREVSTLQFGTKEQNFLLQNLITKKDNETKCTIATVGCIIYVYSQHMILDKISDQDTEANEDIGNVINNISAIDIKDKMLLDDDSLYSLRIFPFTQMIGCDKSISTGFGSMLELLDYTSTSYSKSLLRSWLTFPLTDINKIKRRYSMVKLLTEDQNSLLFDELRKYIKLCPDTFLIVNQLREGKETLNTWLNLEKFLSNGLALFQIICSFNNGCSNNLITQIKSTINNKTLSRMLNLLQNVIDFELSNEVKKVTILDNVNERLQELRILACHIEDLIVEESNVTENVIFDILTQEQRTLIKDKTNDKLTNVFFFPELGFLAAVNTVVEEYFCAFSSLGWEETLRNESHVYFRTTQTDGLTERYGNIYTTISDLEIEILYKLKKEVLGEAGLLCSYFELIGELDIYQSFAKVCKDQNYIEPELSENNCSFEIVKGRHPLYETFVDDYIPNDIVLAGGNFKDAEWKQHGKERIQIITGPNASGKSVYLTQIGLLVYMAQIGCFVPAVKARIGIVDRIFTRIRTQESISKLGSSFQLDSRQIANALALSTEKSLLLIDEFGKGTDIIDGPALFGGIILYLVNKKNCPRTVACTHFHELFNPDVLTTNIPGICHYKTEILEPENIDMLDNMSDENVGVTFLFTIKKGISRNSLGIYCAKVCGMKQQIVDRASQISKKIDEGIDITSEFETIEKADMEDFARKQSIIKSFLSWDLDLESNTKSDILKKKLESILSGDAVPMATNELKD